MADLRAIERATKLNIDIAGGEPWSVEQARPKSKRRSGPRGRPNGKRPHAKGSNGRRRRPSKGPSLAA